MACKELDDRSVRAQQFDDGGNSVSLSDDGSVVIYDKKNKIESDEYLQEQILSKHVLPSRQKLMMLRRARSCSLSFVEDNPTISREIGSSPPAKALFMFSRIASIEPPEGVL